MEPQRDFFGGWLFLAHDRSVASYLLSLRTACSSPLWRQQGGGSMSKSCGGWRKRTSIVRVKYMSVHRKVAQALETRPVLKL